MNCNELLLSSIELEEDEVAYDLLYLLQEGHINYDSHTNEINWNMIDRGPINEFKKSNILNINKIDLYSVLCYNDNTTSKWLMIFASSLEDLRGFLLKELGHIPKYNKMPKHKEHTSFWMPEEKCYKSLWQIKKEKLNFPCIAFEYEKRK